MNDIKVIVTASGCPGASTFIRYLQEKVTERKVHIVAVDMSEDAIGRFLAPTFYTVPPASSPEYIPEIKRLIEKEQPDVFFCVSSYEVPVVSKHKDELEALGTKVVVGGADAVEQAGNKLNLYRSLQHVEGIKIPRFALVNDVDSVIREAKKLGYPEKRVCFKPPFSKGSRGYRVIDDSISRKDLLLHYKPDSTFISMEEFVSIFKYDPDFPELLIMEYVEGEEIDAMTLAKDGHLLLVTCKTRESSRAGVIMTGELVDRPEIVASCGKIIEHIPLDYNAGMQFKGGYLIEINPRVSTFIYQDDLIEPYLSIKLALQEISYQDVRAYRKRIQYGRRMLRYMDQVFY